MNGPTSAELRAVPVEAMREFFRDLAEQSSIRSVAERAGVNHSTFHNFTRGGAPHPRVRRLLALFYLANKDRGDSAADARREALAVLTSGMAPDSKRDAVCEVLDVLERAHRAGGRAARWIDMVRREADG